MFIEIEKLDGGVNRAVFNLAIGGALPGSGGGELNIFAESKDEREAAVMVLERLAALRSKLDEIIIKNRDAQMIRVVALIGGFTTETGSTFHELKPYDVKFEDSKNDHVCVGRNLADVVNNHPDAISIKEITGEDDD